MHRSCITSNSTCYVDCTAGSINLAVLITEGDLAYRDITIRSFGIIFCDMYTVYSMHATVCMGKAITIIQ